LTKALEKKSELCRLNPFTMTIIDYLNIVTSFVSFIKMSFPLVLKKVF